MHIHQYTTTLIAIALALVLAPFANAQVDGSITEDTAAQEPNVSTQDAFLEELAQLSTSSPPKKAVVGTPPVEEQMAVSEDLKLDESVEDDLIDIDTERKLGPGIEVVSEQAGLDLITLTLDDVPLQDVIRMFTRISGANIVAGTNLQGSVTVSLKDVEWKPALDVILDTVDLALVEKTAGIYTVMSKGDLASEPVVTQTVFLEYITISNVMPVVERMLINTNAAVAPVTGANGLVIQETVQRLAQIKDTIAEIDKPRPQVYIEAKFLELNDQAIKDIGVDWEVLRGYTVRATDLQRDYVETRRGNESDAYVRSTASGNSEVGNRTRTRTQDPAAGEVKEESDIRSYDDFQTFSQVAVSGRNFTDFDAEEGTITQIFPFDKVDVRSAILSAEDFELTLSALQQNDGVTIVSNPKVIVANNETATIHVGRNQPNIVAVPTGDTGDRFAYTLDDQNPFIEIGVLVDVTPTVNTEENITVRIEPELSRLLGFEEVGVADISFPITQIRKIITEFNLEAGQTVAIGGLTETHDQETVKKIPLLGDIPLIGKYLFSHTHTDKLQDEIVIFVTVGMANPDALVEVSGIPSEGKLVHEHLARQRLQVQNELE